MIYFIKHSGSGTAFDAYGQTGFIIAVVLALLLLLLAHFLVRSIVSKWIAKSLPEKGLEGSVRLGFLRNTRWWQPLARPFIVGWNKSARNKLIEIREAADIFVQKLNDEYANPSGEN